MDDSENTQPTEQHGEQEQEEHTLIALAETTWLEGIVQFESRDIPGGGKILLYTLANGHRYSIALQGKLLHMTRAALSPIAVVGADALPPNGNGAV